MKILLILSGLFLSTGSALALGETNPNLRICHILNKNYGAEVYILALLDSESDSYIDATDYIPFCRFGNAIMGTPTLLKHHTQAFTAYKNSKGNSSCGDYSATDMVLSDDLGEKYVGCHFADESWVELETLRKGPSHSDNANLNAALGL